MSAEFAELDNQLQQIRIRVRTLFAGLTAPQLSWRPADNRWSIGECLDHLNLSAAAFLPCLDESIRKGLPDAGGPLRRTVLGRWTLSALEPPPRRTFRAPKKLRPRPDLDWQQLGPQFLALQDKVQDRIHRATGLDPWKSKARHFAIPLWRFGLGELFAILLAHERRHLWQAEQVARAPGFASLGLSPAPAAEPSTEP